jgi:AAA+ ATPase superfamily predicted ATPase
MSTFIGRKRELSLLNQLVSKKSASLVVIKGRRRIGKSRLVTEFGQPYRMIALSGLPHTSGMTAQDQRDEISRQMARQLNGPYLKFDDWGDLFWHLAQQTTQGRVVILLDEISWMAQSDSTFLGKLKNSWDLYFKQNDRLILVLCSSISMWIEKNILSSTGFVGRVTLTITLQELTLAECNGFWGSQQDKISPYEKFKCLSVTGGIPNYLENIQTQLSAEENIKRLCFIKEGMLFHEFDQIFTDLFGRRSETYKKILMALVVKPQAQMQDIFDSLQIERSGVYTEYLEDLIQAGFVAKCFSWHIKTHRQTPLRQYRIKDNYIRFYLKYILPNHEKILRDAFTERSLGTLPGWDAILGLQFENLVLNNKTALHKLLHIGTDEIVYDNPYFQRKTIKIPGCQIDYLIQTRFNCLYICEIKFSRDPITLEVIQEMKQKINALNIPKNFSYRPVLIHVNGVQDSVIGSDFFSEIIDFGNLFIET